VLQLKDLREWIVGEKVTAWDRRILKKLEGLLGGRAWFAGHPPFRQGRNLRSPELRRAGGGIVPTYERIIAYWYRTSMITCKWFVC